MYTLIESNPGNGDEAYGPFDDKFEAVGKAISILVQRILSMPEEFGMLDLNKEMLQLNEDEYGEYESGGYGIFSFKITKLTK